jgi:hypothetical protein
MFKIERLESQIIYKVLGAIKHRGLNMIANIGSGHLFLREENLSLIIITILHISHI